MPEQSLKWSKSIDEELVGKMKLRQAVWCAGRSHQVVLTLQRRRCSTLSTAFKFFQLAVQRGPCKITVTILVVTHLKENMHFMVLKIRFKVGLCLSGE